MLYDIDTRRTRGELLALNTARLRLAVLGRREAGRITEYLVNNRSFHQEFSQTHDDSYFTESEQKKYIHYDCESFRFGELVPLWIIERDTGLIIGRVSFFNIAYGGMMNCATGYHLDEAHTSKGFMTEALKAAVQFMFNEYHMHRIEAFILPENRASLELVKRCGFEYEGKRVSYMHINGSYRDHESYYLLNPGAVTKN